MADLGVRYYGGQRLLAEVKQEEVERPTFLRRAAIFGARVVPPVAGFILGGGIPGGIAGGLAGETLAQALEITSGERKELNPKSILFSGAVGGIPAAKIARGAPLFKRLAIRAGQGLVEGAGITAGSELLETGDVSTRNVLLGAGLGGLTGGVAGRLEARALARAAAKPPRRTPPGRTPRPDAPPLTQAGIETVETGEDLFRTKPGVEQLELWNKAPESRFAARHVDRLFPEASADQRAGLKAVLAENPDLMQLQTRGRQSTAIRQALAEKMQVREGTRLRPGAIVNAEGVETLLNWSEALMIKQEGLIAKAQNLTARGETNELLKLEIEQTQRSLTLAGLNLWGTRSEIGRALHVFRRLGAGMTARQAADIKVARRLVREGSDRTAEEIIATLSQVTDPHARLQAIIDMSKPNWAERFSSYFKSSILLRSGANTRNIISSLASIPMHFVTKAIAVGRDIHRARVYGTERTSFLAEELALAKGVKTGLPLGFKRAIKALRTGYTDEELTEMITATELAPGEEALTGVLAPLRIAGRLLKAGDSFVRTIGEEMTKHAAVYSRARREGLRQGLSGDALRQHTLRRMADMIEDLPADVVEEMNATKVRFTYQEDPGKIAEGLFALRRFAKESGSMSGMIFDFMLPFIKTPANIIRRGMINTPGVGLFTSRGEIQRLTKGLSPEAAARLGDTISGEAILGTMLLAPLAWMAEHGMLHGDMPTDPAERARQYEAGIPPNSISLPNGTNIGLQVLGPLFFPATIVANAHAAWVERSRTGEKVNMDEVVLDIMQRTAFSTTKQSFLQALDDVLDAVTAQGPSRTERAAEFIGKRAGSLVPASGLVSEAAQVMSPELFQPLGGKEALAFALPGARQLGVTPRITSTGEVAKRFPLIRPLNDFTVRQQQDVVAQELDRLAGVGLEVGPRPPARKQKIVAWNPKTERREEIEFEGEENTIVRMGRAQAVQQALARVIDSAGYRGIESDEHRARLVDRIRRSASARFTRRLRAAVASGQPLTLEALVP